MARCDQLTAQGVPCKATAMRGATRCNVHLGLNGSNGEKLTEAVEDSLVAMLRAGNYLSVAARASGIHRETFRRWLARGQAPDASARWRRFAERIEKAQAEGQVRHVALIASAAATDWKAAAWLLERQYPALWGGVSKRMRLEEPEAPETPVEADPFAEVDELAARRGRS